MTLGSGGCARSFPLIGRTPRSEVRSTMKRRLCSYDMVEVPQHAFVLTDSGGEMYFCDLRCLCVWSVQLATRPNLSELQRSGTYLLKTEIGEEHQFKGVRSVARWAADAALRS